MTALPPGYDAWRTAGPEDFAPIRPRWIPDEVRRPLLIEAGDVQIDAWGHYETEAGTLLSVEINGKHICPDALRMALCGMCCASEQGAWDDNLDTDAMDEIVRDAADDYADWRYEQGRDL